MLNLNVPLSPFFLAYLSVTFGFEAEYGYIDSEQGLMLVAKNGTSIASNGVSSRTSIYYAQLMGETTCRWTKENRSHLLSVATALLENDDHYECMRLLIRAFKCLIECRHRDEHAVPVVVEEAFNGIWSQAARRAATPR